MVHTIFFVYVAGIFLICAATEANPASLEQLEVMIGWLLLAAYSFVTAVPRTAMSAEYKKASRQDYRGFLAIAGTLMFCAHVAKHRITQNHIMLICGYAVTAAALLGFLILIGYFAGWLRAYKRTWITWRRALRSQA